MVLERTGEIVKRFSGIKCLTLLLALSLSASVVVGCGSSGEQKDGKANSGAETKTADEAKDKKSVDKAETEKNASTKSATSTTSEAKTTTTTKPAVNAKKQFAVIETNKGKIVFEMYPNKAPKTVENFAKLTNSGFYNGLKWHRVEPGFVVQTGDPFSKDDIPQNDGYGGPGYMIKAEISDLKHITGTVAMARGKIMDSAGSQFYICLAPQPDLDRQKFTIFGQVTEGMDVVNKLAVGDTMQKVTITTE